MGASDLVRDVLGEHLFDWFLANKVAEWREHTMHVTDLEIRQYLPRL